MRISWAMAASVLCALTSSLFATDVVLQEGSDYTGCQDSYIKSQRPSENHGNAENMGSKYEKCHA